MPRVKLYRKHEDLPPPKQFGDLVTLDFAGKRSYRGNLFLVVQDAYSKWLQTFSLQRRLARKVCNALRRLFGLNEKAGYAYSDNAKKFTKAFKKMGILYDTSTPYRSDTNGVIERQIRRVYEGFSAQLIQSGLHHT